MFEQFVFSYISKLYNYKLCVLQILKSIKHIYISIITVA